MYSYIYHSFSCFYLFYFYGAVSLKKFFFLTALGLRCCTQAYSSCDEWVLLFVAVRGLQGSHCGGFSCCGTQALGSWASVVAACGLSSFGTWALERRLSSCGAQALLLCGMWDLPGPGLKPMSPALAGGILHHCTTREVPLFLMSKQVYVC